MTTNITVEIDNKLAVELSDVWIISRKDDKSILLKTKYDSSFTLNIADKETTDVIYNKLVKAFNLSKNAAYDYNKETD